MPLQVEIGQTSEQGERERNEDYSGVVTPEAEVLQAKGVMLAVAAATAGAVNRLTSTYNPLTPRGVFLTVSGEY